MFLISVEIQVSNFCTSISISILILQLLSVVSAYHILKLGQAIVQYFIVFYFCPRVLQIYQFYINVLSYPYPSVVSGDFPRLTTGSHRVHILYTPLRTEHSECRITRVVCQTLYC